MNVLLSLDIPQPILGRANYKQTLVADQFDRQNSISADQNIISPDHFNWQNLFSADQSWIFPDHNFSHPDPLPLKPSVHWSKNIGRQSIALNIKHALKIEQ